jgi:hypothetical protein
MAPANTGREVTRRILVIRSLHLKRGLRDIGIPLGRIFRMVLIKLIAPRILDAPETWKLKMARSTDPPECPRVLRGGYTVHPVPAPPSTNLEERRRIRDGGRSQKEMLFSRGNLISGAPIIIGTNQFPNPPTRAGITMKKIIRIL